MLSISATNMPSMLWLNRERYLPSLSLSTSSTRFISVMSRAIPNTPMILPLSSFNGILRVSKILISPFILAGSYELRIVLPASASRSSFSNPRIPLAGFPRTSSGSQPFSMSVWPYNSSGFLPMASANFSLHKIVRSSWSFTKIKSGVVLITRSNRLGNR